MRKQGGKPIIPYYVGDTKPPEPSEKNRGEDLIFV